ncbi:MAG: type I glyceraldehyde-3-phosphate dehydrogenase [Sphingobacteriaceae bacterium]
MRVAINGFGRIGRHTLRNLLLRPLAGVSVVAINDLTDAATLAHLFKYDSVHGPIPLPVSHQDNTLIIGDLVIPIFNETHPQTLPWKTLQVDLVIESTGKFHHKKQAEGHLVAGASQVVISAPSPDREVPTVVLGINDKGFDWQAPIFSNASCTTNNVAPLIKILDDNWQIMDGYITTVHSMTGDQNLHDAPHRDLRRSRAASASIIPTTTGAAKAITNVFSHLDGKLGGAGIRVPVLNGSLTDFTCTLAAKTSVEEINRKFKEAAEDELKDILYYTEDPIVSVDIINNPYSCVFDSKLTSIVGGLVKVVGWYDNEYGYANRLVDVMAILSEKH